MAETFLYLTTTGRKTGKPRSIEIWFVTVGDRVYMISERRGRSNWVRNLVADPLVRFSLGTRVDREATRAETAAVARVVPPNDPVAPDVTSAMDEKYGWSDGLIVELTPVAAEPA